MSSSRRATVFWSPSGDILVAFSHCGRSRPMPGLRPSSHGVWDSVFSSVFYTPPPLQQNLHTSYSQENRTSFVPVLYQFRTTMHKHFAMSSGKVCMSFKLLGDGLLRDGFPKLPVFLTSPNKRHGKCQPVNRPRQNREKCP